MSAPMRRALAFQHLMEHKTICIGEGELIVGEKGPAPKATPTYPGALLPQPARTSTSSTRARRSRSRSAPRRAQVYQETIIPFWQGRSMRELHLRAR